MSEEIHTCAELRLLSDYPGYAVDELGDVYSLARHSIRGSGWIYPIQFRRLRQHPDGDGYLCVALHKNGRQATHRVHRLVGVAFLGLLNGQIIDHINRDKTDNRLTNLRICTIAENSWNSAARSGLKGAHFNTRERKWRAQIKVNGKRYFLGFFGTEEAAHEAYKAKARELHGEFYAV